MILLAAWIAVTAPSPPPPPPPPPPPLPSVERTLTLGVRTSAIADTLEIVPDLSHHGAGIGAFGGMLLGDRLEMRLGVEVRRVDERIGYCLDRCGHVGVDPPRRTGSQIKAAPFMEVRLRLIDIGPLSFRLGNSTSIPIGTSLDGADPVTIGVVHSLETSLLVRLGETWSVDVTTSWQNGMHHVPSGLVQGHTGNAVLSVALVAVFPDVLPDLQLR